MPAGMAAAAGAQGCGAPGRRALYFCGSIRGGREDRALYERIVSRLRRFGTVLTEHVADPELGAQGEGRGRGRRDGGGSAAPLYPNCPGGGGGGGRSPLRRANGGPQPAPRQEEREPDSDRARPPAAAVRAQPPRSAAILALSSFLERFLQLFPGKLGRGRGEAEWAQTGLLGFPRPAGSFSPT